MKMFRPAEFHAALAHMGVSLELSEAREGLSGFSADGQRGYLISISPKGWRAEIVAPEHAMKTLFDGVSKDEAATACLCNEALASGRVSEEIFLHRETGVQLRDSKLLAKGSQYADRHGNQIEISADADNRYLAKDANGKEIGAFSDARLATTFTAIATADLSRIQGANAKASKTAPVRPDNTSFVMEITSKPQLIESATGFARLDLQGKDAASGTTRRISLHGDRAKSVHAVLAARDVSENSPARIALEGRLKPRQTYDAVTGSSKTGMLFEAISSQVLPSAPQRSKQDDALVA